MSGVETEPYPANFGPPQDETARPSHRPPWWMYLIAAPFVAKAVFVTAFCFFGPESMGIEVRPTKTQPVISRVLQDSPAERAGVRKGDVLIGANDRPVPDTNHWYWFLTNVEIGQPIVLETDRGGRHLRSVLILKARPSRYWSSGPGLVLLLNLCGVFIAIAVAFFIAFMRPRHLLALTGALFLGVYSLAVFVPYDGIDSMFRHWPIWYQVLLWAANALGGLALGVWFTFFALFPRPSFRSRWPWALAWAPITVASLLLDYQVWHFTYGPENMIPSVWMSVVFAACWIFYLPGSFAMLAIKYRRLEDETEKRRVRLFVVSLALVVVIAVPTLIYRDPEYSGSPGASIFLSLPARGLAMLAEVAFPICFAYAILRHRLFDIRVIIRQGIRYAAARQLLLLAAPAVVALFVADLYAHRDQRVDSIVQNRGWIYLGLAGLAILAHMRRQRWLRSLDRRFFREQYNAQEILRSTLAQVRAAANLADVAPAVVKQISAAMHPSFCAILERRPLETAYKAVSIFPEQFSSPALVAHSKVVELAKLIAKPVDFSGRDNWLDRQLAASETESLRCSGIELVAPVRNGTSDALIVLGTKRSEEPYTAEDMRLIEDLTIGLGLLSSSPAAKDPETEASKECPLCRKCYDIIDEFCFEDDSRLITNLFPRCLDDRFRLEFRIGQGGMGQVYEAMDSQLRRKVAVKLISEDWVRDPAALDRFRREAHLLASFQHPNVVTLFDAGATLRGRPFLVMERLQGRTLRDELSCRTSLPTGEVRSIVRQLCAALSAAHRRSLIHRDLKPENIFLCDDSGYRLVKILDFGLAKLFAGDPATTQQARLSNTESIAGTPAYMAPELRYGAKADAACDIWALAVITFEIVTGERPSIASNGALTGYPAGDMPALWSDFFNWSLAYEPSQRPESAEIFVERFEKSFR